jgi:serine protease Do
LLLLGLAFSFLLPLGLASTAVGADETKKPDPPPLPPVPKLPDRVMLPAAVEKAAPESIEDLRAIQKQVRSVLDKVMPCTVGVSFGNVSGSAVIVSEDGLVLTAGHVSGAAGRKCMLIFPDGKRVTAETLGSNRPVDSGMMKIIDKGKYPFAPMGKSADLKKGQWCLTLGHPGGFKPGRTPVVRLGRILDRDETTLRSDCTLVGGDSGGPLFDLQGNVIGIHSRIGGSITANVHVPVDTFRDTWDRLVKGEVWGGRIGERATDAYMGVQLDLEAEGCRIAEVVEDTPAAKAGFKAGDVITAFEGQKIANPDDLSTQMRKKKPGDAVTIQVRRDKETLTLKMTLTKRPG